MISRLEKGELKIPEYEEINRKELRKLKKAVDLTVKLINRKIFFINDIENIFGMRRNKYLTYTPRFGARAWLYRTDKCDVILWDEGNGWYTIIAILPHSQSLYEWLKKININHNSTLPVE